MSPPSRPAAVVSNEAVEAACELVRAAFASAALTPEERTLLAAAMDKVQARAEELTRQG